MNTQPEDENIPGNKVTEVDPRPPKKMRDIFIKIYNAGKMHSNQTGCFPATSSKGNQYIMVIVKVDGNYIDAEPMKKKQIRRFHNKNSPDIMDKANRIGHSTTNNTHP